MTKICGYFNKLKDYTQPPSVDLWGMVDSMKHAVDYITDTVDFEGGGFASLKNPHISQKRISWNRDKSKCLVLCGNVVFDETLTKQLQDLTDDFVDNSDSAMLLTGLEVLGLDILGKINGVFSFGCYDNKEHTLIIANDRCGFHPLYYCENDKVLFFASEVKAILRAIHSKEINWEAWADFFYIGHMMGTKTLIQGISNLDSGELIHFSDSQIKRKKYYDFTIQPVIDSKDVSVDRLVFLFTQAVKRRMDETLPNTVLLSGGFDSRLTLGVLSKLGLQPRVVSLEHADEHYGLDGAIGYKMAREFNLPFELRPSKAQFYTSDDWIQAFYILDGMVPNLGLFITQVYPELTTDMGIVWDSLALDMTLGGYHGYGNDNMQNLAIFSSGRKNQSLYLRTILKDDIFNMLDQSFQKRLLAQLTKIPPSTNQFILFLFQNRVRRRTSVNPYQLYNTKIVSSTPTVDIDFLEYTLAIPNELKMNHKLFFEILHKYYPNLVKIPAISGGEIFFARKDLRLILNHYDWRLFAKELLKKSPGSYNLIRHLKNRLKPEPKSGLDDHIINFLDQGGFDRSFYKKDVLEKLFGMYRKGEMRYRKLFVSAFYIELWHRLFEDNAVTQNKAYGEPLKT